MIKDLLKKTTEELEFDVIKKKEVMEKFVQDLIKSKEKDTSKVKKFKKEIAQMKTIISERNLNVKENI